MIGKVEIIHKFVQDFVDGKLRDVDHNLIRSISALCSQLLSMGSSEIVTELNDNLNSELSSALMSAGSRVLYDYGPVHTTAAVVFKEKEKGRKDRGRYGDV